jgi:ubiquinone/menaquinone biosynthesis C-methylase UbiE
MMTTSSTAIATLFLALLFGPAWTGEVVAPQGMGTDAEFARIAELIGATAGKTVADVGAGGAGLITYPLAERVGPSGRVYATEVKEPQVDSLRKGAKRRGLENVEVVFGTQQDMGLPPQCCDGLLLRLVYHAFDEPTQMLESLRRSMKPGGLVLVIDFRPRPDQLTRDMGSVGFDRVEVFERWQGREEIFAVLFNKRS